MGGASTGQNLSHQTDNCIHLDVNGTKCSRQGVLHTGGEQIKITLEEGSSTPPDAKRSGFGSIIIKAVEFFLKKCQK